VEISHGGLFPIESDPLMQALPPAAADSLRRWVRLSWNGEPALTMPLPLPAANPGAVQIGTQEGFPDLAPQFTGTVLGQQRSWPTAASIDPAPPVVSTAQFGPVAATVTFPLDRVGRSEPLITTGVPGAGNFIFVRYLAPDSIQFGYDHWGVSGAIGEPIQITPGKSYQLTFTLGSLYPPEGDFWFAPQTGELDRLAKNQVVVRLDGVPVFVVDSPAHESPPGCVTIGENRIGGSSAGTAFSGQLENVRRLPLQRDLFIEPGAEISRQP
jgi:hypothetical protein